MKHYENIRPKYVLFTLETNSYLSCTHDVFILSKRYDDAKHFPSKESAIDFLDKNYKEISEHGNDWTTREYFNNK